MGNEPSRGVPLDAATIKRYKEEYEKQSASSPPQNRLLVRRATVQGLRLSEPAPNTKSDPAFQPPQRSAAGGSSSNISSCISSSNSNIGSSIRSSGGGSTKPRLTNLPVKATQSCSKLAIPADLQAKVRGEVDDGHHLTVGKVSRANASTTVSASASPVRASTIADKSVAPSSSSPSESDLLDADIASLNIDDYNTDELLKTCYFNSEWTTYKKKAYHIACEYPESWIPQPESVNVEPGDSSIPGMITFTASFGTLFTAQLTVKQYPREIEAKLDEVTSMEMEECDQMIDMLNGSYISKTETTALLGYPGMEVIVSIVVDDGETRIPSVSHQIWAVGGENCVYQVSFGCMEEFYMDSIPSIERFVSSIRII